MRRPVFRPLLLLPLLFGLIAAAACTASEQQDAKQQVQQTGKDIKQQSKDAWAGIRTDGERLADRVQTRNDADAKKELLSKCRDALERMRKADSAAADQVDKLCNQIRDADVNNSSAWNDIKARLNELNQQLGG